MLPDIEKMLVRDDVQLRSALQSIDENAQGIIFVMDKDGKLCGVLTDGDIRRSLLAGGGLETPVRRLMRTDYVSRPAGVAAEELAGLLSERIRHIPLVDAEGCPVDYACRHRLRRIPLSEPLLGGNELAYVTDCVKTGWISSQGSYVGKFESMFAGLMGGRESIAVCNGTAALHLALIGLGVGPGDEVIVPDLTFAATANAVLHAGATPVPVDVTSGAWTIDPELAESAVTENTKAVIAVHLYGHPADMDPILAIARKHGLLVIEDCAEALGAAYKGRPVGQIGDAGCFSFFGNKTVTTGEGGMVVFKRPDHAEQARVLRDHGMRKDKKYWHDRVGYNYRMTNLQAAVGVAQLEMLPRIISSKQQIAGTYSRALSGCDGGITLPPKEEWASPVCWLYTVLLDEEQFGCRDSVVNKLRYNGIEARPVFYPLHVMPPYAAYCQGLDYHVSASISRAGISLPSSASLSVKEVEEVAGHIIDIRSVHGMARGECSGSNAGM